jgi:hypothetical protein
VTPSPAMRAVAREHALEIARLLQSKAVSHRRLAAGEPHCSYRVPLHVGDFWFKVLVSDAEFVFTGEHRRRESFRVPFCASLKHPWSNLVTNTHLPEVSAELGMAVYTQERVSEESVASGVLTSAVRKHIGQIAFAPIQVFFLNTIQVYVISKLISPEHCARQVLLLRELLLTVYREGHDSKGNPQVI